MVKLKKIKIGTIICVVVDIDPVIIIVGCSKKCCKICGKICGKIEKL